MIGSSGFDHNYAKANAEEDAAHGPPPPPGGSSSQPPSSPPPDFDYEAFFRKFDDVLRKHAQTHMDAVKQAGMDTSGVAEHLKKHLRDHARTQQAMMHAHEEAMRAAGHPIPHTSHNEHKYTKAREDLLLEGLFDDMDDAEEELFTQHVKATKQAGRFQLVDPSSAVYRRRGWERRGRGRGRGRDEEAEAEVERTRPRQRPGHTHTRARAHARTHAHTHTHTYTHARTHARTHAHTHTHRLIPLPRARLPSTTYSPFLFHVKERKRRLQGIKAQVNNAQPKWLRLMEKWKLSQNVLRSRSIDSCEMQVAMCLSCMVSLVLQLTVQVHGAT